MAQALRAFPLRGRLTGLGSVSPELAFAIRFAVAVSVAIWFGKTPGLVTNQSTWILITVLIVAQPESGGSILKGLLRLAGTVAAAFISIVLFGLFSQDPPLLLAGLFLVQLIGAYGFSGPRYQYAWFVFAFTTAIILGSAMAGAGAVETIAFQRATMIGLGVLIVFVLDMLLWPAHTEVNLRASLAARARSVGTALRKAIDDSDAARDDEGKTPSSSLAGHLGQIQAARAEIGVTATRAAALQHMAILLEAAASRARIIRAALESNAAPTEIDSSLVRAQIAFAKQIEAALEEVAAALEADRVPAPFANDLQEASLRVGSELARLHEQGATRSSVAGRVANLRDLVALLETMQRTFDGFLGPETGASRESSRARIAARLRPDPFRVQIALRASIAACAALLVPMAFGWGINTLVAPVAFMIAAIPTRGGITQTLMMLVATIGLGWLLADLAIVFVGPELSRMPLALLHVVAVAGPLAYLTAKRPQLGALRPVGGLLALLTVYGGAAAPTDVYGTYNTMCYLFVALAVGWSATQLLWPATAAKLFRERSAAQLELCLSALRGRVSGADVADRYRNAVGILQRYTGQLTQTASLHGQTEHEPVEFDLDGPRRAALLALTQDLFDASFGTRGGVTVDDDPESEPPHPEAAPLREALLREAEAVVASIQSTAEALRNGAVAPSAALGKAHRAVLDCIETLRANAGDTPLSDGPELVAFLERLDARRQIVTRQLALEAWLTDWAAAGE